MRKMKQKEINPEGLTSNVLPLGNVNYKRISKPKDLKSPALDEMDKNLRRIKTAFQELEMFKLDT